MTTTTEPRVTVRSAAGKASLTALRTHNEQAMLTTFAISQMAPGADMAVKIARTSKLTRITVEHWSSQQIGARRTVATLTTQNEDLDASADNRAFILTTSVAALVKSIKAVTGKRPAGSAD